MEKNRVEQNDFCHAQLEQQQQQQQQQMHSGYLSQISALCLIRHVAHLTYFYCRRNADDCIKTMPEKPLLDTVLSLLIFPLLHLPLHYHPMPLRLQI